MEMVAASKMRKSVAAVLAIRPYAQTAWNVLTNLSRALKETENELLSVRPVKKILAIVVTSNRGLCGSFNTQIMKKVQEQIKNPEKLLINRSEKLKYKIAPQQKHSSVENYENLDIEFITVGKKGESAIKRLGKKIIASFPDLVYLPTIEAVRPLSGIVIGEYVKASYDKVVIFYTDFVSVIRQETKVRQILPISKTDIEKQITEMAPGESSESSKKIPVEYKIEPSPELVLANIFPRLIEMQIYHALLESNASKESARMMAMRNATEAASEMADELTFIYNQIRQMKITQEIAEISAGRAAIEV